MFSIQQAIYLKSKYAYIIGTSIGKDSEILIDEIIIINQEGKEIIDDFMEKDELLFLQSLGNSFGIILSGSYSDSEITRAFLDYCAEFNISINYK